jgi:hypothetical protein
MSADETIQARVARGVALLDEKQPGWDALVDPRHLNIEDCGDCVLGQVYRNKGDGSLTAFEAGAVDLIGMDDYHFWNNAPALVAHGFSAGAGENDAFDDLTDEWTRVIEGRWAATSVRRDDMPQGGGR